MRPSNNIISIPAVALLSAILTAGAFAEGAGYSDVSRLISEGQLDESEDILNKKLAINDKDAAALTLLGEVYRNKRDYSKAIKYLDRAISADPAYPIPYIYKGRTYFAMQRFDEIPAEFDIFIEKMKPMVTDEETKNYYIASLHDMSMIYFELKKYDQLKAVVDEILRLSPKDQTALYNLGVYYYAYERNRSSAFRYFTKSIEIDGSTATAAKARYAIEFMRINPDARVSPDFSFIDQEYKN